MSIVASELIFYSSASVPTDDTSTTGGAIDATMRVGLTQFSASAKLALISDGADTRNVDIVGRLASGVVASETVALTNAVEVLSANTYERILSIKAQTTSGTRVVTCKQGSGGSTVATIPLNEKGVHIQFQKSTSESGTAVRYEKQFGKNTNGTNSLLGANVTLTADPQAVIQIGLATAVNGSTTTTNRKTAPAGISFVDDGVAQNVPGTDLAATDAIGVWIQQTLAANAAAAKSTFTLQLAGSTT
jgi:hypothetical protein